MSYEINGFNLNHKLYLFQSSYDTGTGLSVGVGLGQSFPTAGTYNAATYTGDWDVTGKRTLCNTSSVANTAAGVFLSSSGPKIGGVRTFYTKIGTAASISDSRIWSVWTETAPSTAAGTQHAGSAAPAQGYVGFRYDTGAGDTTWKFIVGKSAATTGTQTIVDTGITVATNTLYELVIEPSSETKFTGIINGRKFNMNTGAGNGLSTSNPLYWYTGITTLAAAQKSLRWNHQYLVCG
jgi:hypothetical protein